MTVKSAKKRQESARGAVPCSERSDAKQPGLSIVRAVCLAERTIQGLPLYRSAPFVPKGFITPPNFQDTSLHQYDKLPFGYLKQ